MKVDVSTLRRSLDVLLRYVEETGHSGSVRKVV